MPLTASRPALNAPRQARSQATLERLCRAAAELLEERPWHRISVADVARRARSSVGSFYARFADKEALLDHLDEQYARDVVALGTSLLAGVRDRGPELDALVDDLVRSLVRFHRARPGLIRALVLRARLLREPAYDERTRRMNRVVRDLLAAIAERLPGPRREAARRAFFAFSFMMSALRDRILFPESIVDPNPAAEDTELARELTAAMLAYLGAGSAADGRPPAKGLEGRDR